MAETQEDEGGKGDTVSFFNGMNKSVFKVEERE